MFPKRPQINVMIRASSDTIMQGWLLKEIAPESLNRRFCETDIFERLEQVLIAAVYISKHTHAFIHRLHTNIHNHMRIHNHR